MIYIGNKQHSNEQVEELLWAARRAFHVANRSKIPAGHAASVWCASRNAEIAEINRFAASYYADVLKARA